MSAQDNAHYQATLSDEIFITNVVEVTQPGCYSISQLGERDVFSEALIIAHTTYNDLRSLPAVKVDMVRMANLLTNYGYHVRIWYEIPAANLRVLWDEWLDRYGSDYFLFVYFSGHGVSNSAVRDPKLKNYIFLSGLSNAEFRPFDCDKALETKALVERAPQETAPLVEHVSEKKIFYPLASTYACIVCFDTCLTSPSGRDASLTQQGYSSFIHETAKAVVKSIEKTHLKVTVLYNPDAQTTKDDTFTSLFERELRKALRFITKSHAPRRQLFVTHREVVQKFQDMRQTFLHTTKELEFPVFLLDTLAFGKELFEHDLNVETINWMYKHFAQFIDSSDRNARRWAWIAHVAAPQNAWELRESLQQLDALIARQEEVSVQETSSALGQLERILNATPTAQQEYKDYLLNSYRLFLATYHYTQTSVNQRQAQDLKWDVAMIAHVFQYYQTLERLCNDLGYVKQEFLGGNEPNSGICPQLLRHVGNIPPEELSPEGVTVYKQTAYILEACQSEVFADDIRLLDQIDRYFIDNQRLQRDLDQKSKDLKDLLTQLKGHTSQTYLHSPASSHAVSLVGKLYRTSTFWIIGFFVYIVMLVIKTERALFPGWINFHPQYGHLQGLLLFGSTYLAIATLIFYSFVKNHVSPARLSVRELWWPIVFSFILSLLLAEVAAKVLAVNGWPRIGISGVFALVGLGVCWVGLHVYET